MVEHSPPFKVLQSEIIPQHSSFMPTQHVGESQGNAFRDRTMNGAVESEDHAKQNDSHDSDEQLAKDSQRSDDSFSAYIEHPVRESTPPKARYQVDTRLMEKEDQDAVEQGKARSSSVQSSDSIEVDGAEYEEDDRSWPSMIDHEEGEEEAREMNLSKGSIIIPDLQTQEDDDEEMDLSGEKKRRRRTNKAEASVLASVFVQTQFPDAHTREALAQRLSMKPKAVSIWFQNRRQAMKKRASRFGGVEGVNGPTVKAATIQVLDIEPYRYGRDEVTDQDSEPAKRWRSLDEIVSLDKRRNDATLSEEVHRSLEGQIRQGGDLVEQKHRSAAPILDFICRGRGKSQLSRMASMPSLAMLMAAKEGKSEEVDTSAKKDLRDLLPRNTNSFRNELHRSNSTSTVLCGNDPNDSLRALTLTFPTRERRHSVQVYNDDARPTSDGRLDLFTKDDRDLLDTTGAKVAFPALLVDSLETKSLLGKVQSRNIWQRMESSSSNSSDGYLGSSPDSNKENRDPAETRRERVREVQEEEEDEEQTLRRIAGRRAARDSAKKEGSLSKEGKRYLLEADARLALQKGRAIVGPVEGKSGKMGVADASHVDNARPWNRAASEAQVRQKNRTVLTRVPSLDMTAGRDRSKDGERPSYSSLFQMRMAKRSYHNNLVQQDENGNPAFIPSRAIKQGSKRARYSTLQHSNDSHRLQQASTVARTSQVPSQRRFAPSQSLPSSTMASKLLAARLSSNTAFAPFFTVPSRIESARESSARLDGARHEQQSLPSSQESSEIGSDDWLEAWAQEKRTATARSALSARDPNILRERSSIAKSQAKQRQPFSARHDDSGFYGSDSGGEEDEGLDEETRAGGFALLKKRRHLVPQDSSSSPSKRGDERDRLAAETLLGLGSRS